MPMIPCNICGGREFSPGPLGRLSTAGKPPRCTTCGSLERHRAMRAVIELFREANRFRRYRLIRFSADPIVDDGWFRSVETSIFEGENSLDVQAIDRPDNAYDIVVCSHVLEHVADDAKAIRELARILSKNGFLILAVPRTETGETTQDWGFADPHKNLHYRGYGKDLDEKLRMTAPGAYHFPVEHRDPVTGDAKKFYLLTKSNFWRNKIAAILNSMTVK
jgi:SAM-dependent methyltransferase